MFLLKSIDLIALMGLFVQTFVAWVFVAIFASIRRRERSSTAFTRFLGCFAALACALTFVSVRFFRTHDVDRSDDTWAEGRFAATACYVGYLGCKALFAVLLVSGSADLGGRAPARWMRRSALPLVAAMAGAPLLLRDVNLLLIVQAPVLVACAALSHRALARLPGDGSGLRLVRSALVALAVTWGIHAFAVLLLEVVPALRYLLAMNSMLDLGVQLALGTGLIICMLQESHRRARAAEEERERLQRTLDRDQRLRALGTLVSGVAHELNNPLTVILGYADLVGEPGAEANAAQVIREQAERCRGIVRNLSALAGQSVHPCEELEAARLLERVERGIASELLADGRRIERCAEPGLRLYGDRVGLEQVLTNLVVNALQASPPGGVVRVTARRAAGGAELLVDDQGEGIAEAARPHLFEPFFTTKGPGQGTGLGLSIAHAIVRAHGGSIAAEAAPSGTGARFRVRLPPAPIGAAAPEVAPPLPAGGRRLLIVDDDAGVRSVVRRHAEQRGWVVAEAASAEAALAATQRDTRFDALLCDLRMPGMGGVGFHDRLAELDPDALRRTVFVTGDLAAPDLAAFARRCRRPLLQKPFDFGVLFAAVDGRGGGGGGGGGGGHHGSNGERHA
ncbi:MAG: hybrid sensor histidine kinase/response regulator [Planctomycetes bacterium]|nr:hybrid sensor histidine kinase/response regulator [Planctomycetota bacterium]